MVAEDEEEEEEGDDDDDVVVVDVVVGHGVQVGVGRDVAVVGDNEVVAVVSF